MERELLDEVETFARAEHEAEVRLLRRLARIPAPSGKEQLRARFVARWLAMHGATDVEIGKSKSVVCYLGPSRTDPSSKLAVFAAHMDIVQPDTTELPEHEDPVRHRMWAPGIGDDTANLVALLSATRYLLAHHDALERATHGGERGILVVADSGEEGLGNLRGTRALFERFGNRIEEFTSFDLYLPQCISEAVGSERWRVRVTCQGGHSFQDFGRPNAIAVLSGIISDIYASLPPDDAPCTYNVGKIVGGTSVNAIAADASALVEYRSTSQDDLALMRGRLESILAAHRDRARGIEVTRESIGLRPATGDVDQDALRAMTERNADIIRTITGEEPDLSPASTDANVPLSLGIRANTLGTVRGGLLHTRDEWVDTDSLTDGLAVALAAMLS